MNLLETANSYLRAGLSVVPALISSKRPALPAWSEYQKRLPTQEELRTWFDRDDADAALCLICGAVSGNLEMIDFDQGGEHFDAWAKLVKEQNPGLIGRLTIEQSQSGGWHAFYRCENTICGNVHLAQRAIAAPDGKPITLHGKSYHPRKNTAGNYEVTVTLIETRGEGGIFLCHPSPRYMLAQGAIDDLPLLTVSERDLLLEAAWSLNEVIPAPVAVPPSSNAPPHQERPGDAFNERGDVVGLLRQHGWTLACDGENQHWRRPGKTDGASATLKDRVFYVFSSNAVPFEQGKAYGPFAVYTLLEQGGDYARAASTLRGQGFGASPAPHVSLAPESKPSSPPFLSVRQLVAKYPNLRVPIIHGLLRTGETMNLVSAPKIGKSWLVLDLALSVVTGRPWLDQYQTERGEVLILDNELHPETLANRIPRVAEAMGIGPDQYADRLFVKTMRGELRDLFSLGAYFNELEPGRFKLIICDAFYRFLPRDSDENDNGTMANLYNTVDNYAAVTRAGFVLIHHMSKGNQSQKAITDLGAGAGSQSRAADAHIGLRRHEEDDAVVLEGETRAWPRTPPFCLKWSFPLWRPAPELDPTQLQTEKPRKRKNEAEPDLSEAPTELTLAQFVQQFVAAEPRSPAAIVESAVECGITRRQAERKLRLAEESKLIHRWFYEGNRQKLSLAPQPAEAKKRV